MENVEIDGGADDSDKVEEVVQTDDSANL